MSDLQLNDLHTLTRMKYIIPNVSTPLENVLNEPNDNLTNLIKYNNLLKKKNISNEGNSNKLYTQPYPLTNCPLTNQFLPKNDEKKRKRKRSHIEKEELQERKEFDVSPQAKKLRLKSIKKEKNQSSTWKWENFK